MNSVLQSRQFKQFEAYLSSRGITNFLSLKEQSGAVVVSGDLETGKRGVEMLERDMRRRSLDWIPATTRPKLPAPLSKMTTDQIRSSAAEFLKFWRGKKVQNYYNMKYVTRYDTHVCYMYFKK